MQGCGDPGDDVFGFHGPVQAKDVDELPGGFGIAVGLSGRSPEGVVGGGEPSGFPGLGQCRGPGQRTRFYPEDFQVVVQLHALPAPGHGPGMGRDQGPAIEDPHLGSAQGHTDFPVDEPHRNGILR